MTGRAPSGQALVAPQSSPQAVSTEGFDPSRSVRRTAKPFATAPLNGNPFHILSVVRFNPASKQFETLCYTEAEGTKRGWVPTTFRVPPTYWVREVPMPYEIPARTWFAFTITYRAMVKQKSRLAKFWTWLRERSALFMGGK